MNTKEQIVEELEKWLVSVQVRTRENTEDPSKYPLDRVIEAKEEVHKLFTQHEQQVRERERDIMRVAICPHELPPMCQDCVEAERQIGGEEALRNVPVGFVRQWINEDLLKEGHRLITDEDIQKFINIALRPVDNSQHD